MTTVEPQNYFGSTQATLAEKTIPLAEIFGPTIQGEGALAGKPTYFLRIGGCDYKCDWCDTGFSVNPEEVRKLERVTQADMIEGLKALIEKNPGPRWLSISGGNPGMYDLGEVVNWWQTTKDDWGQVTVETQGSRWQPWFKRVDMLTISPKPPSSGLDVINSMDNLRHFMSNIRPSPDYIGYDGPSDYNLKVICFDEEDYAFAQGVRKEYPLEKMFLSCGTAMGGLDGKWVPPMIPDLELIDPDDPGRGHRDDYFRMKRAYPSMHWSRDGYTEPQWHLLRRYRWLVERASADPLMADVAIFPQIHALIWGINTKGV